MTNFSTPSIHKKRQVGVGFLHWFLPWGPVSSLFGPLFTAHDPVDSVRGRVVSLDWDVLIP